MRARSDLIRQLGVTAAFVVGLIGVLFGTGALGTRVEESSGGALAADATLLSPAGPAFSIWTVIYAGLVGYVIWQWLPVNAGNTKARGTGWWAAASMLLNGLWLFVTQFGWIWVSVVVILVLAYVCGTICVRLAGDHPNDLGEQVVLYLTFGLYLGWVSIATVANITAAAVGTGISLGGAEPIVAVVVLVVATGLGVFYSRVLPGQWAIGAAMAWGISWIAVGRLLDEPRSALVGIVAAVCAAAVLAAHLIALRAPARVTS